MTSALEHRVYLLERALHLEEPGQDIRVQLRSICERLDELERPAKDFEARQAEEAQRAKKADLEMWAREERVGEREMEVSNRERDIGVREEAVKAREEQYARAVDANPLPPAHPKDAWLTELAAGARYLQFVAAGWTDELLEQRGLMALPRPVREAVREFKLQNGVDGVFA